MIIPIYWGTRGKLKKDLPTGLNYCSNCRRFTAWFIGRNQKVTHFEYIPLSTKTVGYFYMCGKCQCGKELTEPQYHAMKTMYLPFCNKKAQIQCYEKANAMAQTMPKDESSVNAIMTALSAEFPVSATPQLDAEYRRRIRKMLGIEEPEAPQAASFSRGIPGVMEDAPEIPQQTAPAEMPSVPAAPAYQNAAASMPNAYAAPQNPYPAVPNAYAAPQNPYPAVPNAAAPAPQPAYPAAAPENAPASQNTNQANNLWISDSDF